MLLFAGAALFVARLLAEQFTPPWPAVLALAALACLAAGLLAARARVNPGARAYAGPALALGLYVLWPWRDDALALACGVVALGAALLVATRGRRIAWPSHAFPLIIFAAGLALYSATLAPGVLPADAGELQRVAAQLGLAHPPGYPLYTLLGRLFTLVPVQSIAWRVNWFSAATMAAALALTASAARRLSGSAWGGLAAAVALATCTSVWSTATQASIRPLEAFFAAGGVAVVAWIAAPEEGARGRLPAAALVLLAAVLGLGIGHHLSLAVTGLFFAAYVLLRDPSLLRPSRRWAAPLAAFALSLLVLAYLPLRNPALANPGELLYYVLARGFEGDMLYFVTREPALLGERLALLPGLLRFEFDPLALLAAALGALLLLRDNWRLCLALLGAWLAHTFVTLTYRAPQTVEYMIPAYVLIAVAAGYFAGRLWNAEDADEHSGVSNKNSLRRLRHLWAPLGAALVLWSGIAMGLRNAPSYAYLAQDQDTRDSVMDVLDNAPPSAAILSNWHWATPMQYLQQIEGVRPDVEIVYVYPRDEALADTWVSAIRETLPRRPVVVDQYFDGAYAASGLRFEPLGREAWAVSDRPRTSLPGGLARTDALFRAPNGEQVRVLGYRVDGAPAAGAPAAGGTLYVSIAWTPAVTLTRDYHFFVHLLGAGAVPIGQSDRAEPSARYAPGEIILDRHAVTLPPAAPPGAYALRAGVYDVPDAGGFTRFTLPGGADALALPDVQLGLNPWPLPALHAENLHYPGGPTLVGHDYEASSNRLYLHWVGPASSSQAVVMWASGAQAGRDALPDVPGGLAFTSVHQPAAGGNLTIEVEQNGSSLQPLGAWGLPALRLARAVFGGDDLVGSDRHYVPLGGDLIYAGSSLPHSCNGDALPVDLDLLSARPLVRDLIVSVHADGRWSAQSDSVPALGAIPTLKWLYGSRITDRHVLFPSAEALGTARVTLIVYDAFTQRALPVMDPDVARLGPSVPLGECSR